LKANTTLKVIALTLILMTVALPFLATPVSARTMHRPTVKIVVDKSNLPSSITITVEINRFKADAYLTNAVDIIVSSPEAGGLSNQFVTLNRAGSGSVVVSYPDDFVGGQYFQGFGRTCTVDVNFYCSSGIVHASTTFRVRR
jgi:hypothetical protein